VLLSCVVPGDYGSISLKFPVSALPADYNTSQWMSSLKDAVVTVLTSRNLQDSQIEIESTQVTSEDEPATSVTPSPAQKSPGRNLLRRSDTSSTSQKLFVNVNILPLSASVENITSAKTVSKN
jgi:hypothetical protein